MVEIFARISLLADGLARGDSISYLILSTACLTLLWCGWRLWRFTIFPALYPEEPRQLPYLIPYVGHTIDFMRCAENVYIRGNKYFKGDELYGLTIAGGTTVVVRNTADIAAVWKNTTTLSYDPFTSRMLTAFGISPADVKRLYTPDPSKLIEDEKARANSLLHTANPKKKHYMNVQSDWFKTQLLPGEHLDYLQDSFLSWLRQFLTFDRFDSDFLVNTSPAVEGKSGPGRTVILGKFCRYMLSRCSFRAFFGDELFQTEPDIARLYQTWEDNSWKVFYNYPHFLAPELHDARMRVIAAISKYFRMPLSERPGTAWIFQVMDKELQTMKLSNDDRAGLMMMICWAINNNAHYISFWMWAHMLSNPPLLEAVKKETDACCTSDGSCDLEKLSNECPHLHAVWYEALRLYNAATTVRKAVQDIHIGGKIIHNGDQIFGPLRNYQLDGKTFGANPLEFNAYRFLEKPNLTRSKKYFPFGGGHTYCPGRYFAEREIYMFIALTLKRFDIQITTPDGVPIENPQAPPVKINVPAPAAMAPTRDIYVTLRERVL